MDLNAIKKEKESTLNLLLSELKTTDDAIYRNKLALFIVDNFRGENIIPTLMQLINSKSLRHSNGTLIYACEVYSADSCREYIDSLIDIVIHGDSESSWSASSLICAMNPLFDWDDAVLNKIESKLKRALAEESENKRFIENVISRIG